MTAVLALPPREEDDDPRGRDQQPEADIWVPGTVRHGPNHLAHAGHRDREASR